MSEAIETTWLRRLRYTPLRDLLRGRISGRLDLRQRIDSTPLPPPARELIARIVKRTRLFRIEKIDVADELIAHFLDGIDAGATPEHLVESFGDERSAAKLIRRAKKRNRGMLWQAQRAFGYFLGAVVALYLLLAVIYFTGRPSISVDYVQKLNQPIEQASPQDRAWPMYRSVLLSLDPSGRPEKIPEDHWTHLADSRPGSKRWLAFVAWLDAHPEQIEQLRQAAAKPALGFVLGSDGSVNDPQLFPKLAGAEHGNCVLEVLLPQLNEIRLLAQLLSGDVALSLQREDHSRAIRDIDALIGMAEQLRGGFLVSDLVSLGLRQMALLQVQALLLQEKQDLPASALRDLAHKLSAPQVAADLISIEGERLLMADCIQRMYSDDGHGDGRITSDGLRFLRRFASGQYNAGDSYSDETTLNLFGPLTIAAMASRSELLGQANRLYDIAAAAFREPLRSVDWNQRYDGQIIEWHKSLILRLKYLPLVTLMPSFRRAQANAESYLGHRDGVLVAIALEIHRRAHGSYPESLNELVPGLLPSVPTDRMTGDLVRYRLIDAKPVVYSAGGDRDDDGGRPYVNKAGEVQNEMPGPGNAALDGDWILFPTPPEPPESD